MERHCFFIGTTLGDNPVPHHFVALGDELIRRGHEVVFIAPHRRTDLETRGDNRTIYTWPSERPTHLRDGVFLQQLIRRHRPTCFIANFSAVNIMTLLGWLTRIPVRVAWYHTVSDQLRHDHATSKWKQALLCWRKQAVYRAATHVVAVSKASQEDVRTIFALPQEKCRTFHNSLADPLSHIDATAPPIPGRLVCVGRLYPSKGQDVLLRALAILKSQFPIAHLELIGQGPSQEEYQRLARELGVADRCHFVGHLTHREVLQRMSRAIATVVPSRSEAFGLVNLESLALGIPVVASKVGGIPEIVRDGTDGFLVPPDNPETLAERLGALIGTPALRKKMRLNARQQFLCRFEQRRAVLAQADWFESILPARERISVPTLEPVS